MTLGCSGQLTPQNSDPEDSDAGVPLVCQNSTNQAPNKPEVMTPEPGRIDILSDALMFSASTFQDDDGDAIKEANWEIWQVASNNQPVQRVWSGKMNSPLAALSQGVFEVGDSLASWGRYSARVAFSDDNPCSLSSDWSDWRDFRIDDGSSAFFAEDSIQTFRITIPEDSWGPINDEAKPPGCVPHERNKYEASVIVNEQNVPVVGLRSKGGCGSARNLSQKMAFKVDLEWSPDALVCPAEVRIDGQKHLTLNNQVQDPSFIHERMAYLFYRSLGVPAPRASPATVYVNDQFWGVYLNVETVDRRMLERWFGSNKGMLYEGTYFCDLKPENVPTNDEETNDISKCLGREFEGDSCSAPETDADPTNFAPIRSLTQSLAALPEGDIYPAITNIMDFDRFLSMWAASTILGHWDGYEFSIVNNYRVYHDPFMDNWTIIPSGTDQTFSDNIYAFAGSALLPARCLQEVDCKAAFAAKLKTAVDVFESLDLASKANQYRDQIKDLVMMDPRKETSYDNFLNAVDATKNFINTRPAQIRQQLIDAGY